MRDTDKTKDKNDNKIFYLFSVWRQTENITAHFVCGFLRAHRQRYDAAVRQLKLIKVMGMRFELMLIFQRPGGIPSL